MTGGSHAGVNFSVLPYRYFTLPRAAVALFKRLNKLKRLPVVPDRILLLALLLLALGCTKPSSQKRPADSQRMAEIVEIAQRMATVPQHHDLLGRGTLFVDIEGLDIPCVGVSVPNPNSTNRILISFTQEWFTTHSDDEIAMAILSDLQNALAESASEK